MVAEHSDLRLIRGLSDQERYGLRKFCQKRLGDNATAEAAKATLAALDTYDAERNAAERLRQASEADRIRTLSGEARMIAELQAAHRAREIADRTALDRLTPDYIASKLLEAVAVLVVMPIGWIIGEIALGHVGGLALPFILVGMVIWMFAQHRKKATPQR